MSGELATASSFGPEHRDGSTWGMQRGEVFCFSFLFAHKQIAADDTVIRLPGLNTRLPQTMSILEAVS